MELIKHTSDWVNGEVYQGKTMLVLGFIMLIALVFIFNNGNDLMRGMLIPFGLIALVLIGYGSMQTIVRPKHNDKVSELLIENPKIALEKELEKATKDNDTYRILKIVWPICIIISIGLYFIFSQHYFKGLSIGLIGLFLTLLILDSVLHHRLEIYIKGLQGLIK